MTSESLSLGMGFIVIVEGAILLLVAQVMAGFAHAQTPTLPTAFPPIDEVAAVPVSVASSPIVSDSLVADRLIADPLVTDRSVTDRLVMGVVPASETSLIELQAAPFLLGDAVVQSEGVSDSDSLSLPPDFAMPQITPSPRGGFARRWLGRRAGTDYGLAYDRVMLAPIFTDTALGVPSAGLQFRLNRGASRPDRLEYLWARAGKGPAAETGVDMLDSVFRTELGNARSVLISEISMRSLDPERAPNTTGFGDMVVGGKTILMDGTCTKLSTIFLTHLHTGPADRGLGTGHISLEPGLLGMHQWSERTFLHGAIQYRLPIAGTRNFAGDVLATSWAASTVWHDSDTYAWMPVLEFQTHSFLFGAQTEPDGSTRRVNGTTAFDILPGSRFTFAKSALGACELGVSAGWRCSDADWFDSRMMFDIRWLR